MATKFDVLVALSSRLPGEPDWSKSRAEPAFSAGAARRLQETLEEFDAVFDNGDLSTRTARAGAHRGT